MLLLAPLAPFQTAASSPQGQNTGATSCFCAASRGTDVSQPLEAGTAGSPALPFAWHNGLVGKQRVTVLRGTGEELPTAPRRTEINDQQNIYPTGHISSGTGTAMGATPEGRGLSANLSNREADMDRNEQSSKGFPAAPVYDHQAHCLARRGP